MPLIERPRARAFFLALVLCVLLAGDAWRYTIGWWGYGVLVALIGAASVWMLVAQRTRWRFANLPNPLFAFLALATASLIWSFYPGATAIGLTATWLTTIVGVALAVTYSWPEILRGLAAALRVILGLSFLFELYVSLIVRGPILPLVPSPGIDYAELASRDKIPLMLFWSRNELFEVFDGGRIQGVAGNSVLLAFIALVGVIVFALRLGDGVSKRRWNIVWLAVSGLALLFTRSATITVALVAVVVVAAAILLIRRTTRRGITYAALAGVVAIGLGLALVFQKPLFALLGKSEDLTGRLEIWGKVLDLAQQRPVAGWGWVSHWIPGFAPFDDLVFRNGVRQLHAHDAWIDVFFQLGIIGLIVFGALVRSTLFRSFSLAVDHPQPAPGAPACYRVFELLPLLILVALLVQSIAESRLLVEFGFAWLVLVAVKTKIPDAAAQGIPPR
ncbi:hypothetical protein BH10ACT7_BH10ACT7_11580 [soil metagenome]